jgi:hypothetical protein
MCLIRSALFDRGSRGRFGGLFRAANARGLAFQLTEVVQLRAADAARLQNFDRADHGRIYGEDSFNANSETDPPNCECCASKMASPADHNPFERLHALFFPFGLFEPNVHTHGVTGAERGDILASLVLMDLLKYATHMDSPGQTRYGGASAKEDA